MKTENPKASFFPETFLRNIFRPDKYLRVKLEARAGINAASLELPITFA
jgi:hypothetical protein